MDFGHIPEGSTIPATGPALNIPQEVAGPFAGYVVTPKIIPWPNQVGVLRPLTTLFANTIYPLIRPREHAKVNQKVDTFTGQTTGIMRKPYQASTNRGYNG